MKRLSVDVALKICNRYSIIAIFALHISCHAVFGQSDSSYYKTYPTRVTGRFYASNKYTTVAFKGDGYKLDYQPNTSINLGVGATYKWATLNIGIGFLNRDVQKGKTKYLDLQFHNYGRKFTLDVLGEFYNGFYLYPSGKGSIDGSFYRRPDINVREYGANFQYIVNHRYFSYRSAFLQNEWQKKSAGSLLVGIEVFDGRVSADSSIAPHLVDVTAAETDIHKMKFFEIGPNLGYAYTLVFKKHFFLTGSAAISADYCTNSIATESGKTSYDGVVSNKTYKFCAGYNSNRYSLSALYTNNPVRGTVNGSPQQMDLNTGNFRIIFVHRFIPTRSEKKVLNVVPGTR